jgi:hypothetical protein
MLWVAAQRRGVRRIVYYYRSLLFLIGDESAGGEGRAACGCRSAFGAGGGGCCLIIGYIEVLAVGIGLMLTSTFGIGVDWFRMNKERMAITGKKVKSRIRISPRRVIRR